MTSIGTSQGTSLEERLRGRLVVSCQAPRGGPLDKPSFIAALASSAVIGGAGAVRISGLANIRAVRRAVDVPLIGLVKRPTDHSPVYITPTIDDAVRVADAGADLVALDATDRTRPDGRSAQEAVAVLVAMGLVVVADVDDLESGVAAGDAGARFVATTLAGYTTRRVPARPDVDLVAELAVRTGRPVIAEGRYRSLGQVRAAFRAGAHAVVIGNAITNPTAMTARFVAATPGSARLVTPSEPDS